MTEKEFKPIKNMSYEELPDELIFQTGRYRTKPVPPKEEDFKKNLGVSGEHIVLPTRFPVVGAKTSISAGLVSFVALEAAIEAAKTAGLKGLPVTLSKRGGATDFNINIGNSFYPSEDEEFDKEQFEEANRTFWRKIRHYKDCYKTDLDLEQHDIDKHIKELQERRKEISKQLELENKII